MRKAYLVIITGDTETISVFGTLKKAKSALRKEMERLLNDPTLDFSDEDKKEHRDVFKKTGTYAIRYIPCYGTGDSLDMDYIEYGEIRVENIL